MRRRRAGIAIVLSALAAIGSAAAAAETPSTFREPDYVMGSDQAPVTVIEYLSDTCAHCAAFDAQVFAGIKRDYIDSGQVRYVIREMPTAPVALSAAGFLMARCAGRERYWAIVEALFRGQPDILSVDTVDAGVAKIARVAGLDEAATVQCLSDPDSLAALEARRQAGFASGVDSTPTFVFADRMLKPGRRLAGRTYAGGELSRAEFDAALRAAQRSASASGTALGASAQ